MRIPLSSLQSELESLHRSLFVHKRNVFRLHRRPRSAPTIVIVGVHTGRLPQNDGDWRPVHLTSIKLAGLNYFIAGCLMFGFDPPKGDVQACCRVELCYPQPGSRCRVRKRIRTW